MHDLMLRAAEPKDAPAILALLREMADYVKAPHFTLNEGAVRRDMFGVACHCDLLFCGGEAAGIATWFWTYKSFRALRGIYVEDLFVRPPHRGRGAGQLSDASARVRYVATDIRTPGGRGRAGCQERHGRQGRSGLV